MQRPSAVRERWWTGLNFTFQTNGPAKGPLLCSKNWPKLTTILNWLKAWRALGDENKSLLSSVKCSTSKALECNGLITSVCYFLAPSREKTCASSLKAREARAWVD